MSIPYIITKDQVSFRDGCLAVRQSYYEEKKRNRAPGPKYNPERGADFVAPRIRNIARMTKLARSQQRDKQRDKSGNVKNRESLQENSPGPQTYNPNWSYVQPKHTGSTFGKDGKNSNNSKKTLEPSPEQFDPASILKGVMLTKNSSTAVRICKKVKREKAFKPPVTPSPQEYDPAAIHRGIMSTKVTAPAVTKIMKQEGRNKTINSDHQPGPQSYDTDRLRRGLNYLSTYRKPPGIKIATSTEKKDRSTDGTVREISKEEREGNKTKDRKKYSKAVSLTERWNPSSSSLTSSMGKQIQSTKRTEPSMSFGTR